MSESNTIVINTRPIKKITLSLGGKEHEILAYMSMNDLQVFYSEIKKCKDYKRALSAVISEKINAEGVVTNIDEIYEQDDAFLSEYIATVVDKNEYIEKIYADTSQCDLLCMSYCHCDTKCTQSQRWHDQLSEM